MLSRRRTLDERKTDACIVSVRSHSRLNLNDSALGWHGERCQQGAQRCQVNVNAVPEIAVRPELGLELRQVGVFVHEPEHPAEDGREAVWQPVDSAEVEHAEPPVGKQAEVARVRIRVQESDPGRTREHETDEHDARPVPLSGRAAGDDRGERDAVKPFADEHVVAGADHTWDADVRVVGVAGRESLLGGSFQPVVEFLGHPLPQLGEQRLDLQARHERAEEPGEAAQLAQIADQRPARARVLDLDGNLAPVGPDGPVHLADGRGGRRLIVELGEAGPPLLAHIAREHLEIVRAGSGGADSCSLVRVARYGPAVSGGSAASNTDSACPSFIAPPLSSPRTLKT